MGKFATMTGADFSRFVPTSPSRVADAVSAWSGRAATGVRRHRQEFLILAGTAAFVVIVALLGLTAVVS